MARAVKTVEKKEMKITEICMKLWLIIVRAPTTGTGGTDATEPDKVYLNSPVYHAGRLSHYSDVFTQSKADGDQ